MDPHPRLSGGLIGIALYISQSFLNIHRAHGSCLAELRTDE
jgi:hypothetical protein